MDPGALVVLTDGEPTDAALVGKAREYADEKGCPVTLVRVLPEVTRARTDNGEVILPWQVMPVMESNAKFDLEGLRARFLRGREHSNTKLIRFGRVPDELVSVVAVERPHPLLSKSRPKSLFPGLN